MYSSIVIIHFLLSHSTNKTDWHNITEILLKVVFLNTITPSLTLYHYIYAHPFLKM